MSSFSSLSNFSSSGSSSGSGINTSAGHIIALFAFTTVLSMAMIFTINAAESSNGGHKVLLQVDQIQEYRKIEPVNSNNNHNPAKDAQGIIIIPATTTSQGEGDGGKVAPGKLHIHSSSSSSSSSDAAVIFDLPPPVSEDNNNHDDSGRQVQTPTFTIRTTATDDKETRHVEAKDEEDTKKTSTSPNFLTFFKSQIIKLFSSLLTSNINLVQLREETEDRKGSTSATEDIVSHEEPAQRRRMKRSPSSSDSKTLVMNSNSNRESNNNNNLNENLRVGFVAGEKNDDNHPQNSHHYYPNGKTTKTSSSSSSGQVALLPAAAAVTSDFHKIRHAMKKLENDGGLEGDVVLRMMLGPNANINEPPRPPVHHSQQQQQQQSQHGIPLVQVPYPSSPTQNSPYQKYQQPDPITIQSPAPVPGSVEDPNFHEEDETFKNFRDKLTSLKNQNIIDWKAYTDEDDDDIDELDQDEENLNNEQEDVQDDFGTESSVNTVNWALIQESAKIPSSSPAPSRSPFIYRAVIPSERKHTKNYYSNDNEQPHQPLLSMSTNNDRLLNRNRVTVVNNGSASAAVVAMSDEELDEENLRYDEDEEGFTEDEYDATMVKTSVVEGSSTNENTPEKNSTNSRNDPKKSVVLDSICYKTDDVLIVIGITCVLNFSFVLIIWTCVKWFSLANSGSKEKQFQHLDCEDGTNEPVVFHNGPDGGDDEEEFDNDDDVDEAVCRQDPLWPSAITSYGNQTVVRRGERLKGRVSSRRRRNSTKYNHYYTKGYPSESILNTHYQQQQSYNAVGRTTSSLYSFRSPENCIGSSSIRERREVPQENQLKRSHSYSMEDLRYYYT